MKAFVGWAGVFLFLLIAIIIMVFVFPFNQNQRKTGTETNSASPEVNTKKAISSYPEIPNTPKHADSVKESDLRVIASINQKNNNDVFTDNNGKVRKVRNTAIEKGLFIQVTLANGKKEWKKHGPFYNLDSKKGHLNYVVNYSYGIKEGLTIHYYANQKTKLRMQYKEDKLHGLWEKFRENGNKATDRTYVKDKKHGIMFSYSKDGTLYRTAPYLDGKIEGEMIFYHPNGTIKTKYFYTNNKRSK